MPVPMDHAPLHRFTLRFASATREAAFAQDYFRRSLILVRLAILIGCGQLALFGFLDSAMITDGLAGVRLVRFTACALILALFGVTYTRHFTVRSMQGIVGLVPFVAGVAVSVMALIGQDPNGYYDYYAGLML